MNPAWKLVPLREVIIQAKNETMIISESLYKQITVRLNHKGVQQRALVTGGQVASKQYLARKEQFIISQV